MTTTPNYSWTLPTINADADTWGAELNSNLTAQDTQVKAISDVANAASTTAGAALTKSANLSDLVSATTARTNLGLGLAAIKGVTVSNGFPLPALLGIPTINQVAYFGDSNGSLSSTSFLYTDIARNSLNLSDLASASTARTNLGVTATGADTTYAFRANNLSDLANAATARTNLGLGTAATQASTAFDTAGAAAAVLATSLQKASNLSDVANNVTARQNLGFKTATSSDTAVSQAGTWTFTHSFAIAPQAVSYRLVCITSDNGYGIGDIINVCQRDGFSATMTLNSIVIRYNNAASVFTYFNATTGTQISLTNGSWNMRIVALGLS